MTLLPKQLRGEERVPVFDPADCSLCLVAFAQLDRPFIPLQGPLNEGDADCPSCRIHCPRHTETPSPF